MEQTQRQTIAQLGQGALLSRIREQFTNKLESTLCGAEETASVALFAKPLSVTAQTLLLEGIDFDLCYFPLKYLGYKAVTVTMAKVAACNAQPAQVRVALGLSQRFYVDDVEAFFSGVSIALNHWQADLCGLELKPSYTGLTVSVTCVGEAEQAELTGPQGAQNHDLICLSGSLGAAFMGLQLLEREKKVFTAKVQKDALPQLEGYEFLLQRYLRPEYPMELLENLRKDQLFPTSMTLTHKGLANALHAICEASGCGAKIFLDKIPIAQECFAFAKDWEAQQKKRAQEAAAERAAGAQDDIIDPIVAALAGGEDYQLVFTLPLEHYEHLAKDYNLDIIGHICPAEQGCHMLTPNGQSLDLSRMTWGTRPQDE